jgi:D-alanyl-lipoteichoic acid acyltransferase DltB (MBOAT superfamily)
MGLIQIGATILTALLIGVLTWGARSMRTYLLLAFSVFAVYWFQPLLPLRSFDFWLPSLSLALVILTWLITSPPGAWRIRQNIIGFLIIIGSVTFIDFSRYWLPEPVLTATTPPQFFQYLVFVLILGLIIFAVASASMFSSTITGTIILLIIILILLKNPALSLQTSIFFRTLANRSVENASFTDLRWLGFSYIAFRLIHVLRDKSRSHQFAHSGSERDKSRSHQFAHSGSERDKQMARLPELSLPEFATYVVFFPSLTAGPIDRVERFAQDLRVHFVLSQDETLLAGQRIFLGLFKKFVIADALALIALNDTLATQVRTTGWMWIIVYAYAFQIYFDFSGYTDIAIGIARLVGIKLPENFAAPYTKPNLTQFWNSWHMTLTQWFRSYFFNPFNRWMRGFKNIPAGV